MFLRTWLRSQRPNIKPAPATPEPRPFYDHITTVHLEVTSKCNAACPQCIRNLYGGPDRPNLELAELTLADIQTIFPASLLACLKTIYVNGNYGDGAVAKDILEIFAYFRATAPHLWLILFTNGSVRTPDWWRRLADHCNEVQWGIDGLADTNHLYRRQTDFHKIIANARAFTANGGKSIWTFNVFRHNEHQVEEARQMAKDLGFADFRVRKTARFEIQGHSSERHPVHGKDGRFEYFLEMPRQTEYRNAVYDANAASLVDWGPRGMNIQMAIDYEHELLAGQAPEPQHPETVLAHFSNVDIDCRAQKERTVYVSATGHVYPCCWLASYSPLTMPAVHEVRRMEEQLPDGKNSLNAKHRPLADIVEDLFFKRVQESWQQRSVDKGLLTSCAETCRKQGTCYQSQLR